MEWTCFNLWTDVTCESLVSRRSVASMEPGEFVFDLLIENLHLLFAVLLANAVFSRGSNSRIRQNVVFKEGLGHSLIEHHVIRSGLFGSNSKLLLYEPGEAWGVEVCEKVFIYVKFILYFLKALQCAYPIGYVSLSLL